MLTRVHSDGGTSSRGVSWWIVVSCFLAGDLCAERPPDPLRVRREAGGLKVELPRAPIPPVGGTQYRLEVEASEDLRHWQSAGVLAPDAGGRMATAIDGLGPGRFYRLRAELQDEAAGELPDGAETQGYRRVFEEEVRQVGWLTPGEFADQQIQEATYLDRIRFDPRTARYWDAFNADPAVVNQGKTPKSEGYRLTDFRLNAAEMEPFLKNGFVVSERLGGRTFAGAFYRVFSDDLPVFISADAALHAWHMSYQRLLTEMEETELSIQLEIILRKTAETLSRSLDKLDPFGPMNESAGDALFFLGVGRELLAPGSVGLDHPLLRAIRRAEQSSGPVPVDLFGCVRPMDSSQFTVRGPYRRSQTLSNYFQAYLWCSRADLRIFDTKANACSLRQLGTAVLLTQALRESGQATNWNSMDEVIRLFVGKPDSMSFAQLDPLLVALGKTALGSIDSREELERLQAGILEGSLGIQAYAGDVHASPFGPEQAQLPRNFVFTGQRFVPDGWALAQITFDRIPWFEDLPDVTWNQKVLRRVCSAVDVAYAVFGNAFAGREIARRMMAPRVPGDFRDGLPYAHRLVALARTFDRIDGAAWEESLYNRWLLALRELSRPSTDAAFPEAMRTRAWANHTLNAQLASYAELKHDTLLYAKQPYASIILCEYPAGFVEPKPAFWRRMSGLAMAAHDGMGWLPSVGDSLVIRSAPDDPAGAPVDYQVLPAERRQKRMAFCLDFADRMNTLATMAEKELRQEPFTASEIDFIRGLMNQRTDGYGGATYDGWYPGLFYEDYALEMGTVDANGSNQPDALIADIFAAPADLVDPQGGVLHIATGDPDLLMIAVDNGPDRMIYAGPVLSYYEFLEPGPTLRRLSDGEWRTRLANRRPARPEWTSDHLVVRAP